jgi:hypothetical protein
MIDQVYDDLSNEAKTAITEQIVELIRSDSHVFRVDVHLCFALRVLQHPHSDEVQQLLKEIFEARTSEIIRRDIILIMALWGEWYWLSDLKNRYRQLRAAEKRALLVASYSLNDEGRHWRSSVKKELNPFEKFVLDWACKRVGEGKRSFPL